MEAVNSDRSAQSLDDVLCACELEAFKDKLTDELGITKCEDVEHLQDTDLKSIGLTIAQLRRLQGMCRVRTFEEMDDDNPTIKVSMCAFDEDYEEVFQRSASGLKTDAAADGHEKDRSTKKQSLLVPAAVLSRSVSTTRREASSFWQKQAKFRPRRLIFVRHGESEGNVQRDITRYVPDHALHLTATGREQALAAGVRLKALIGEENVKCIVSPYVRTRETCNGILNAWGTPRPDAVNVRTDVRIREMEMGNFDAENIKDMHKEKKKFGAFYYRFRDGESPADCYDRASLFLESMYRSWEDNTYTNYVIVGHGMMLLVMIMRLFRYDISMYDQFDKLENTEIICMERPHDDGKYKITFAWPPGKDKDMGGLRTVECEQQNIWDGNPGAPLLVSEPAK